MTEIAGKDVGTNDLVVMGAGVLMLIDSFIHWYGVGSYGISGWHSHFWAVVGILLVLAAGGVVAARVFGGVAIPTLGPVGPALLVLALSGLGALCVVIRLLTENDFTKFGLYAGIIIALVSSYGAFMAFKASGEALPDLSNRGGGTNPPPPSS